MCFKRKLGVVVSIRISGLRAISEETELEKSHSIIKVGNLGKGSSHQKTTPKNDEELDKKRDMAQTSKEGFNSTSSRAWRGESS